MPRVELYVPDKSEEIITKAKKILNREGSSLSKKFLEDLEKYVRLHEPGNPQQTLDYITKTGKAYRAPLVCERCGKEDVSQLTEAIFISGAKLKECDDCFNHAEKRKLVKRKIRVIRH